MLCFYVAPRHHVSARIDISVNSLQGRVYNTYLEHCDLNSTTTARSIGSVGLWREHHDLDNTAAARSWARRSTTTRTWWILGDGPKSIKNPPATTHAQSPTVLSQVRCVLWGLRRDMAPPGALLAVVSGHGRLSSCRGQR